VGYGPHPPGLTLRPTADTRALGVLVRADVRGRITPQGPDRAGACRWEIFTDQATAELLMVTLGGVLSAHEDGWRLVTCASRLRVRAATNGAGGLVVTLDAVPLVGFALAVPSWQIAHVCDSEAAALLRRPGVPLHAVLTAQPVDMTTGGGRLVRFCLPKLTASASAAA